MPSREPRGKRKIDGITYEGWERRTGGMVNVRKLREEKGWKQGELAERSGVSPSVVSNAEAGDMHFPTISNSSVKKMAGALGVHSSEVTMGIEEAALEAEMRGEAEARWYEESRRLDEECEW